MGRRVPSSSSPNLITSVTLNPAIDEAVSLAEFHIGAQNRGFVERLDPGGKGVNASRMIRRLGRSTIALGFIGGVTGQLLRSRLDDEHVIHAFDDVAEETRINVMIHESANDRRTRLYLQGANVPAVKLESLRTRLAQVHPGSLVVFGGSVPPGIPTTIYRDLVAELRARAIVTIVDTHGEALRAALEAKPFLIKPDVSEAEELLGRTLADDDAVFAAACELRRLGADNVVISQGRKGAIAVGRDGAWKAFAPPVDVKTTIGAGDSMVAGLAIGLNEARGLREALCLGTAAGAATVMMPGTQLGRASDVWELQQEVRIETLAAAA